MTSNRMAAAAALRRNIALRTTGGSGVSLRSTRTSEVSSFVKNCNKAENYALRRELNIWHKDTNFAVRKVTRKQDDMYRALLKLSKTKKEIKIVKQDQLKDKEELRKWIDSKRRCRRHVVQANDESQSLLNAHEEKNEPTSHASPNVLKIDHTDSQGFRNQTSPIQSKLGPASPNVQHQTSALSLDNLSRHNKRAERQSPRNQHYNEEEHPRNSIHNVAEQQIFEPQQSRIHFPHFDKQQQGKRSTQDKDIVTSQTTKEPCASDQAIDAVGKANIEKPSVGDFNLGLSLGQVHLKAGSHGGDLQNPNSSRFSPLRPLHAQRLKNTKFLPLGMSKALTEEDDTDLETTKSSFRLDAYPEDFESSEGPEFGFRNEYNGVDNVFPEPEGKSEKTEVAFPKNRQKRNKPKRRRLKLKSNKPDPTEELINTSTIAVRPGKSYDVTVYKKGEAGDLEGDVTSWSTTVDVAKYFHLSSRRERLQREKLLEDARDKEAQQRHRVDRFLQKLSRELETDERAKNYNRDAEEARLKMQRRLEALKRGPPKYGVGDVTTVPNYVRLYPRLTTEERKVPRTIRKRSSWSVPSLFTLQIAAANPRLVPPIPGGARNPPTMNDASSHLVNINLDKYLLHAADS